MQADDTAGGTLSASSLNEVSTRRIATTWCPDTTIGVARGLVRRFGHRTIESS